MIIPDEDEPRFKLIIKYIKENKAEYLDNIITYIKIVQTKKQYKGVFKNLFSAKFQHINWRYEEYIGVVKMNTANTAALGILIKHNLLQETLLDGSVFITACKENHYNTIDLILSIPEYGYNMINHNNYNCVYVVCDRGYKESFNVILLHLSKFKIKYIGYDGPEIHRFVNSDRNAKSLELMLKRDNLQLFKIYCKYVCSEDNINVLSYQDLYNCGAVNCIWWLIKLIKKYKITITFAKNGYYVHYKIYRSNASIADNMLDSILLTKYLKRTIFI